MVSPLKAGQLRHSNNYSPHMLRGENFGTPWHKQGIVGYWPLSQATETGGKARDFSGNGLDLTISDATYGTDRYGNADKAMVFDTTPKYLTVANTPVLNFTEEITMAAWVYWEGIADTTIHRIMEKIDKKYILAVYGSSHGNANKLVIGVNAFAGILVSTNPLPLSTWVHVLVTYDRTDLRLYVNGTLCCTPKAYTAAIQTSTSDFYISRSTPSIAFPGKLAEERLYNQAMTPWQASKLGYINW